MKNSRLIDSIINAYEKGFIQINIVAFKSVQEMACVKNYVL